MGYIPVTNHYGRFRVRAREFEADLASLSHWGRSEIEQRLLRLRKAGLIPLGGRGLNAPPISAEHAACILIAMAGTSRADDTTAAAQQYGEMIPVEGVSIASGETFYGALAEILRDTDSRLRVQAVVICR